MIFNTIVYYLAFLFPTSIVYRRLNRRSRPWAIVVGGILFFLYFAYGMAGSLGSLCVLIFLWEAVFSRLYKPGSRWCYVGLIQSLILLVLFKYWNFFTQYLPAGMSSQLHWRGAFLPLGISFFTFEFYHYAWDRQRGKVEAGSLGEYLAFILFFPTMVAGPIKRYQDFLPKLRAEPTPWAGDFEPGITRILSGLVKKFAIADLMTAFTDHLNIHDILIAKRWVLPLWLVCYGIKIYFDFSAYSDIAIGSARLFGLRVPENFDWPYGRTNIAEFWAHWHISLTRWLTDYVFIPLGGSRRSQPRVYANVLMTMLISGLWHGAGLNFLVWGLWHGVFMSLHRIWRSYRGEPSGALLPRVSSRILTLSIVMTGWAFFCMDLSTARVFFHKMIFG